jgi:hypothetical protein
MTPRFWTCALVTSLDALARVAYAVAALNGEPDIGNDAIYAVSQSLALLLVAMACAALRSRIALTTIAFLVTLLQVFDGIVGLLTQDPTMKYWPLALALINTIALAGTYAETASEKPAQGPRKPQ